MKFIALAAALVLAQDPMSVPLSGAQRRETVHAAANAMADGYLEEETGRRVARRLETELERGTLDRLTDPPAFASALEDLLHRETNDPHMLLWHGPLSTLVKRVPGLAGASFGRTEVLPGEIGYVEIRNFLNADVEADQAMAVVERASALVFDLRETPGGNRQQVVYLASYLFDARRHLLNVVPRAPAAAVEAWTIDDVHGRRHPQTPVYVLVSAHTASAGEMFAFALQRAGRAVIVGEKTAGAGHSVRFTPLPNGFFMLVPITRNVDPRTGGEWEGVGVRPDIDVPSAQALEAALAHLREHSPAKK